MILSNINLRKRIKELESSIKALLISEEKYKQIWEYAPDAIFLTKIGGKNSGTILDASPAASSQTGYSREELIGMNIVTALPSDKEAKVFVNDRENDLKKGDQILFIEKKKRKDGSEYWTEVHITNILVGGEYIALSINRDITQSKVAEEALLKSENNLRALFNAMTDIVFEIDNEGRYVYIAPTSPELLYKPTDDLLGRTLHEIFPKSEADKFLEVVRKCLDENKTVEIEYPLTLKDKTIWFQGRATPKTSNTILYIANEITDRKKAEEALKESEAKFKSIFENKGNATGIFGEDGIIKDCNSVLADISGYSKSDIINKMKWSDFVVKEDLERMQMYHSKRLKNGDSLPSQYECGIINKKGEIINVIVNIESIGEVRIVSLTDITKRKQDEEEILKLKEGLEVQVAEKTKELNEKISDLQRFVDATIERELRIEELYGENEKLKEELKKKV